MGNYKLEVTQRLMLVQGISLIEDGLTFLEWCGLMPNECSFDTLNILRDRFECFKDFALDETECNYLFVDKSKRGLENVKGFYEGNKKEDLLAQLKKYRAEVVDLANKREAEDKN